MLLGWVFLLLLLLSISLGVSSINLFVIWSMMEVNSLSFVSLAIIRKMSNEMSVPMKYFLIQGLASAIFLSVVVMTSLSSSGFLDLLILISLSIKLGAAPFHSWFINVASNSSWEMFFILATAQKVLPLYVGGVIFMKLVSVSVGLCLFVSVIGVLASYLLSKLLAYSSVFMLAWLMSVLGAFNTLFMYLMAYAIALGVLIWVMVNTQVGLISDISVKSLSAAGVAIVAVSLLSMVGLPPFLMFLAKALIVQELIGSGKILWAMVLILFSIYFLYAYMSVLQPNLPMKSGGSLSLTPLIDGALISMFSLIALSVVLTL